MERIKYVEQKIRKKQHTPDYFPLSVILDLFNSDNNYSPEVLFYGDSVVERISRDDQDQRTLGEMVCSGLKNKFKVAYLSSSGYHLEVFYQLTLVLQTLKRKPSILIVPINIRSFSPQWHLNPFYQATEDISLIKSYLDNSGKIFNKQRLSEFELENKWESFLKTEVTYPLTPFKNIQEFIEIINNKNTSTQSEKEFRLQQIFIYHYLYQLQQDHCRLIQLKDLIKLSSDLKISLVLYVTPINYRAGSKYVGDQFRIYLENNVQVVKNLVESLCQSRVKLFGLFKPKNLVFKDFSQLLGTEYFFHEDNPTEHLNEKGRQLMAKLIAELCLQISS